MTLVHEFTSNWVNTKKIELFYRALSFSHNHVILFFENPLAISKKDTNEIVKLATNNFGSVSLYTTQGSVVEHHEANVFRSIFIEGRDLISYEDISIPAVHSYVIAIDSPLFKHNWETRGYDEVLENIDFWDECTTLTNTNHIRRRRVESPSFT